MKIKLFGKELPIIAIAAPAAILVIIIIIVAVNLSKAARISPKHPIDMNSYVDVITDGYNGYACASVSIDWESFDQENKKKYSFTKAAKAKYGSSIKNISLSDIISDFVYISLDKDSNISNDDVLKYNWSISDEISDYVICYLDYDDETYKVNGLPDAPQYDFFEGVELSYSKISPNGKAELLYSGTKLSIYDFTLDKSENIRNDEVLTVSLNEQDDWYYLSKFNAIPSEYTKSFIVSGLDEYVSSIDSIPEESLSFMKNEASDYIISYIAREYSSGVSVGELEYAGYIINCQTSPNWSGIQNNMFIIYRAPVSISTGKFRETTVYYPVCFSNLIISGDEFSYNKIEGIIHTDYIDGSSYYTRGYVNPCTCYSDLVTARLDGYITDFGEGFEIYTDCETVSSIEDMPVEYRQQLIEEALDIVDSYTANLGSTTSSTSATYVGEYLLTAKNIGNDYSKNNIYVIVLVATVTRKNNPPTIVYFPVTYKGLLKMPNEEYIISNSQSGIVGYTNMYDSHGRTIKGYLDGEKMYNDIITANRNNYTYEVSEGLLPFGA